MIRLHRLLGVSVLALACSAPAWAASSAVYSASESIATSVGSVSRSVRNSSDSSSRTVVGQGEYEVIRVAAGDDGLLHVTLMPLPGAAAPAPFTLLLPERAAAEGRLAVGERVSARDRPYGLEFARADTRTAFFLLLQDDWMRELQNVPVTL